MKPALLWLGLACFLLASIAVSIAIQGRVQYYPVPDRAAPHDVAPAPDGTTSSAT